MKVWLAISLLNSLMLMIMIYSMKQRIIMNEMKDPIFILIIVKIWLFSNYSFLFIYIILFCLPFSLSKQKTHSNQYKIEQNNKILVIKARFLIWKLKTLEWIIVIFGQISKLSFQVIVQFRNLRSFLRIIGETILNIIKSILIYIIIIIICLLYTFITNCWIILDIQKYFLNIFVML